MKPMEILAPVGGQQQLIAAVRCGANAVYLGTQGFNARRNAENFGAAALREAVSYCHARNVKVYVTVNTLITDGELPRLVDELHLIADSGADALIVQDLAVARLAKQVCPSLALHGSTQMSVHNLAGAQQLEQMGFGRVVLARELTAQEIAAVHRGTSLELEVFVHGALCMSVSGQCTLSSMIGERSGNRGLCAQPCRLNFQSGSRPYALSMKDMSFIPHLQTLSDIGAYSLKIEGRMKRPEYVAAAVTACKQAMAGQAPDMQTLEAVFSRSGFTDGYLTGRRDLSMFGTRTKEDVHKASGVLSRLSQLYARETPLVPVDMALTLAPDAPARLVVTDGTHNVEEIGPVPQVAQQRPTDEALARRSLQKTGGTPFRLRMLSCDLAAQLMLPAAELNALRKAALDKLLLVRSQVRPHPFFPPATPLPTPVPRTQAPALRVRVETADQLGDWCRQAQHVIVPVEVLQQSPHWIEVFGDKLIGECPALTFPSQEAVLLQTLQTLRGHGLRRVIAGDLGALQLARTLGFAVHGGHGLNILNSLALDAYAQLGLCDATVSFEINLRQAQKLAGDLPRGLIGYGRLPLMLLRACPAQGPKGCGTCDGHPQLVDRKQVTFPLLCHRRQYTTLLNSVPLYLADQDVHGVDFVTLYFTLEDASTCQSTFEAYRLHLPFDGARTRGLYFRALK